MYNNNYYLSKFLFMIMLIISSIISISANSWLSIWMGLEINLLSFIPLISDNKLYSSETSIKYFLIQAIASSIFLFSIIMMMNFYNNNNLIMMFNNTLNISLLLKMGAAPFHFWYPLVTEGLSWPNTFILITWQKLIPLMILSYSLNNTMIILSIIMSSIIGTIGALNQTSLRKLISFSSINHLSWMMVAMMYSNSTLMMYFIIYSYLNYSFIFTLNLYKMNHINQLMSSFFMNKQIKLMLMINLLSLYGLPPLLGFFPKWIIIQMLSSMNMWMLLMIMLMTNTINLFLFIRMSYTSFILNYYEITYLKLSSYNNMILLILLMNSFMSMFSMFLIPMFMI